MAQYGKNFYGSSYYGRTNAYSGWYTTREIFTDETLQDVVNINIRATLPSASYGPSSPEVTRVGTWTENTTFGNLSSDMSNSELVLTATCDEIVLQYEQRTLAATVTIEVTTSLPGETPTVQTFTLNTQGASVDPNKIYRISGLAFGKQKVRIILPSNNTTGKAFYFKSFSVRTANLTIESRARLDNAAWDESFYKKVTMTTTPISGTTFEYMVTGSTVSYAGKNKIQLRIFLASSDDGTTPEVQYIETTSGNTKNRTADGNWTAIFDMKQIAIQAGTSFSKVEEVVWTENVPDSTSLTIRSQSSSDNLNIWDDVTVPYKLNTNRIRLKEGYNTGWIDSPILAPASKKPFVTSKEWDSWDDQSFLPPDSAGISIKYDFLNTQKDNTLNPYVRITNPMNVSNRNLRGGRLRNLDNVLRITLKRTAGKQTPVVDYVNLLSYMHYEEDKVIEDQEFSAVDFNNTGKGAVLDMSTLVYQVPSETSNPTYELIDETGRPQDILFYFQTEKDEAIRTGKTTTLANKVWAEARVQPSNSTIGLIKNYQYGGGQVNFPLQDKIVLAPTFTPSLKTDVRYRYYLDMGWPTQFHTVIEGDTLDSIATAYGVEVSDILKESGILNLGINMGETNDAQKILYSNDGTLVVGQQIRIPNDTYNDAINMYWQSTNDVVTMKSSQNAVLQGDANVESDTIIAEVKASGTYGWVDWVSEEKIYDGVVNLNDIRGEYKRTHSTPESGTSTTIDYIAVTGDTYKSIAERFGVYEEDVRRLNTTVADEQPVVGQRITVPSRIVLPEIHPKAYTQDNPYDIEIVYNSVKKTDGKILGTNNMVIKPVQIEYKEVTMTDVEVVRGTIDNGRDLLGHARVKSIIRAQNADKTIVYNPWNESLQIGDFKQDNNYIDWSPTAGTASEPPEGQTYYVDYVIEIPSRVTVTIDTTYYEEGGVDRIWRSPEVKEFSGMCYPGTDHVALLPDFSEWMGLPDPNIEDIEYIVEDNDIWVKTWIEKRNGAWYIIGSLQDRVPKDNWFPTIKTGYYYLGKDEYYLFNEPITIEPTDKEIPIAENVEYVEGKFQNAVQVQEGSRNLIKNSGFDIASSKTTTYRLRFDGTGVAGLGLRI